MKRETNEIRGVLLIAPFSVENPERISLFFHDSIHTYSPIKKDLSIIKPKIKKEGVILCDNMGVWGGAFNEFLKEKNLVGYTPRDFGGDIIR